MKPTLFLEKWLRETPGPWKIGEVEIRPGYELSHVDRDAIPTIHLTSLHTLMEWVKLDAAGSFRPLRAAPNLRKGWHYSAGTLEELMEALDVLYPTAIAYAALQSEGKLDVTPFLQTAERQTGMYHCARLLSVESVCQVAKEVCEGGCLKRRLWEPAKSESRGAANELPLLCVEACNYFVAKAREQVKRENLG